MNNLFKTLKSGIGIFSLIYLSACESNHLKQEERYLTGIVKDESFSTRFVDLDIYTFSLNTEHGLKIFKYLGTPGSLELESLISSGDSLKVLIGDKNYNDDKFYMNSLEDIKELNGKKLNF